MFVLGLFILNVVLRDESLRGSIIENLQRYYSTIISYKLTDDLNEVFICSMEDECEVVSRFKSSCEELNAFFKMKQMKDEIITIEDTLNSLNINK